MLTPPHPIQGRRNDEDGEEIFADWFMTFQPGDYGLALNGLWNYKPPTKTWRFAPSTFPGDKVTLHLDNTTGVSGTISVEGLIQAHCHTGTWNGYLQNGIWLEA
jgi:hypothetical protein